MSTRYIAVVLAAHGMHASITKASFLLGWRAPLASAPHMVLGRHPGLASVGKCSHARPGFTVVVTDLQRVAASLPLSCASCTACGPAWCRGSITARGSGLGRVSHRQRAPRTPRDCSLPGAPSEHTDSHTLFAPDQSSTLHCLSQVDSASAYLAHVMRLCQGIRAEPPKKLHSHTCYLGFVRPFTLLLWCCARGPQQQRCVCVSWAWAWATLEASGGCAPD